MPVTITYEANDKRQGMTLGELQAFLAEAQRAGLPTTSPVKVTTGWRSQIATLKAAAPKPAVIDVR